MKAKTVQILLAVFFLFPFLGLIFFFRINFQYNFDEILWALKNSFFQSSVTAIVSVLFGCLGALGIASAQGKIQRALKMLAVVPVFLPTLFTVMIGFSVLNTFPMGSAGVIFILTLMYAGFAASLLSEEITAQLGQLGFVAEVYGVSKFKFRRKILWPLMSKPALYIGLVIFVNALTSFTVPLLVGGGRGTNLEVLIFEKIFIDQNWSLAVGLSFLQMGLIAMVSLFLKRKNRVNVMAFKASRLIESKIGLLLLVGYLVIYFSGYIKLALGTLNIYYMNEIFNASFYTSLIHSIGFFVMCALLFFGLFCALLFVKFHQRSLIFINFFLNPSSVLVGFSLYLLFPHNSLVWDFVKLALVFALVGFVSFFKSTLEDQMQLFEKQMLVARSFGLSFFQFLFYIYLPQIKKRLHYVVSLLFVFSVSEYGLVKASGVEVKTLGAEMAIYLSSYRIEGAFIISLIILLMWICATLLSGAMLGVYQKSKLQN